ASIKSWLRSSRRSARHHHSPPGGGGISKFSSNRCPSGAPLSYAAQRAANQIPSPSPCSASRAAMRRSRAIGELAASDDIFWWRVTSTRRRRRQPVAVRLKRACPNDARQRGNYLRRHIVLIAGKSERVRRGV